MALRKEDIAPNTQQTDKTKKRSRITFDVSPELRRRIKLAALQDNLSVGEYVSRILEEAVPEETSITQRQRRPVTRKTLEAIERISEKIMRERNGKLFENSNELIDQMREERTRELMGEV
jgi:predicted metal-dependent RNase